MYSWSTAVFLQSTSITRSKPLTMPFSTNPASPYLYVSVLINLKVTVAYCYSQPTLAHTIQSTESSLLVDATCWEKGHITVGKLKMQNIPTAELNSER